MENNLSQSKTLLGQPVSLYRITYLQMWERFSYFGLRGLLVFFIIEHFGFNDARAFGFYGLVLALCYTLPFIAGWICDRYFQSLESVIIGGLLSLAGLFVIFHSLVLGTALCIVGTSVFRPSAVALIGDLCANGGGNRPAGFALSHLYVNLGAALGPLSCCYIANTCGWQWGFGLAAMGLFSGLCMLSNIRLLVLPVAFSQLGVMTYGLWSQIGLFSLKTVLLVGLYLLTIVFLWAYIMLPSREHEGMTWPHYGGMAGLISLVSIVAGVLHFGQNSNDSGPTNVLIYLLALAGSAWFFAQLRATTPTDSRRGKSLFLFWVVSGLAFAVLSSSGLLLTRIMDSYEFMLADESKLREVIGLGVLCLIWSLLGRRLSWNFNNCTALLFLSAGLLALPLGGHFSGWSGLIDSRWLLCGGWALFLGELILLPAAEAGLTELAPEGATRTAIGAWLASMVGVRHLSLVMFQATDLSDLTLIGGLGVGASIVCYYLGKRLLK